MNDEELKKSLTYLINKYISDVSLRNSLIDEVLNEKELGVKGILHEINCSDIPFDDVDSKIVKDIAFNFV